MVLFPFRILSLTVPKTLITLSTLFQTPLFLQVASSTSPSPTNICWLVLAVLHHVLFLVLSVQELSSLPFLPRFTMEQVFYHINKYFMEILQFSRKCHDIPGKKPIEFRRNWHVHFEKLHRPKSPWWKRDFWSNRNCFFR